jgi:hypothetical protein
VISDLTTLFNLACNAIGGRDRIASPTENSREAQVCSLWYPVVRDKVFAAAPWPELTKIAPLTLLDTYEGDAWVTTNARPGYTYAYALPNDCIQPQYLTGFERFLIQAYPTGTVSALATNVTDAILAYTSGAFQPPIWSGDLGLAMVYALASHIVMPITGKVTRAKQMADMANNLIMSAREAAANTSNEGFESIPDWIAARGYAGSQVQASRYIYPYGDLLTVASV